MEMKEFLEIWAKLPDESVELHHSRHCIVLVEQYLAKTTPDEISRGLMIINDSGLDLNKVAHKDLFDLKIKLLRKLEKHGLAEKCLEDYCVARVRQCRIECKYEDGLEMLRQYELQSELNPGMIENKLFFLKKIGEGSGPMALFAKCNTLYNLKKYGEALKMIDEYDFDPKCHPKLLEIKAYCLKALGRQTDAFAVVTQLLDVVKGVEYKITRRLFKIIGDDYVLDGDHEGASKFYRKIAFQSSYTDEQYFLGLAEGCEKTLKMINNSKKTLQDVKGESGQTVVKPEEAEDAGQTVVKPEELEDAEKVEDTGETVPVKETKTVSFVVDFILENNLLPGKQLLQGTRRSRLFNDDPTSFIQNDTKSFIDAEPSQVANIAKFIDIGSNTRYIVSIEDLITVQEFPMLVVEPLIEINSYFEVEANAFASGNNFDDECKARWWKLISENFRSIFGDVIHGLMYLNSLEDVTCDLRKIYVNEAGEGKILPIMDGNNAASDCILNLIKKMKEIITLPFPEDIEVQESYNLPQELTHFFGFVTREKLKHIPFFWLVNHPYFWSIQEKIDFIKDIRALMKEKVLKVGNLNSLLKQDSEACIQTDWSLAIDGGVDSELYKQVFRRPLSGVPSLSEKVVPPSEKVVSSVKAYDPHSPIERVRYMSNCYNHVNDTDYQKWNASKECFSRQQIEARLSGFFPKIYIEMYQALYKSTINLTFEYLYQGPLYETFEEWSRLYLAPKSRGTRSKDIFHQAINHQAEVERNGQL